VAFISFDQPAATNLPANWTQTYFGAGSGTSGTDGDGNAVWNVDGGAVRGCLNRHLTPLATDTQVSGFVLTRNLATSWWQSSMPMMEILCRMNSAGDAYISGRITPSSCEIGYVVSGVYTRLGAAVTLTSPDRGSWQITAGESGAARQFILYQNGVTRVDRTDGGAASQMGASYRYCGFRQTAGVNFNTIFFQLPLPPARSFSASDRSV